MAMRSVVVCDCCGQTLPAAGTPWDAYYNAALAFWGVPTWLQGNQWIIEGYFRCRVCVAAEAWPRECHGLAPAGGPLAAVPVIRLAGAEGACDVALDDMPAALLAAGA